MLQIVRTLEVVASAARNAAGNTGVIVTPEDATGLLLLINGGAIVTAPSLVVTIDGVLPQDETKIIPLISTAAITTANQARRLGVLPGVVAVANVFANEPLLPKYRISWTLSGGTITFDAVAVFYR